MQLYKLTVDGFLCFDHLELSQSDLQNGCVLITGVNRDSGAFDSNGSGKTSLLEAIVWCLFGKTSKGVSADAVVNRQKRKGCMVMVTLVDTDGELFTIARHRRHQVHGNEIILTQGDSEFSGVDQQSWIDSFLGCDYRTFSNAFFFGQGTEKYFAGLTDAGQKEILSNLLNLGVLSKLKDAAKVAVVEAQGKISDIDTSVIADQAKLTTVSSSLKVAQEKSDGFDDDQKAAIKKIEEEKVTKEKVLADIKEALKLAETADVEAVKVHTKQLKKKEMERDDLESKIDKLSGKIEIAELALKEHDNNIIRLKASRDGQQDLIAEYADVVEYDSCPTCFQQVGSEHKEGIQAKIEKETSILKGFKTALKTEMEKRVVADEKVASLKKKRKKFGRDFKDAVSIIQQTASPEDYEQRLANNRSRAESDIRVKKQEIATLDTDISRLLSATNPHTDTINACNTDVALYKDSLNILADERESWEILRDHRKYIQDACSNKGAASRILKTITPFLNDSVSRYANILTGGAIDIAFSTERELQSGETRSKFNIDISTPAGATAYKELSGGEKRRVDICVTMALRQLALQAIPERSRLNVAVFDEIFEGLDETGCDNAYALLREEYEGGNDICFVITHNPDMEKHFPKVITVEKRGGFSTIENDA